MSFQPGVPMQMGTPVYATTSVPSATMMVKVSPVPTQMMVGQVVQQQAFMPTIQAQPISHMVTQPAQIIHHSISRPIVSQAPQLMTSVVQQQQQQQQQQHQQQKEQALEVANQSMAAAAAAMNQQQNSEPSITVFVGNITDRASDTLIRQILMKCGAVYTWKRVQGASGKLQAFGFCEYKDPEAALRAIHILHDYELGDKKLLVKVDAKTQTQIDDWKRDVRGVKDGEEFKLTGIEDAHSALASLMLEYANELNTAKEPLESEVTKPAEPTELLQAHNRECPTVRESNNIEENLNTLDIEEEQKTYISKEIRSFREHQKAQEEKQRRDREQSDKGKDKDKDRTRDRDRRERRRDSPPRSSRNRSIGRRSESRRSPPRRSPPRRSPPRRSPPRRRSRSPRRSSRRSPQRSRSPNRRGRKRSMSSSPISLHYMDQTGNDEEADAHEKRRMERKIKEKEAAYQERLRAHEMRERRKRREAEKHDERERRVRKEMEREAKRLREFLADYDDERFDCKFYQGSELAQRRMDREVEITADQKDRKKEQEEIDILRKRLLDADHHDPEGAIAKAVKATEDIWLPLIAPDTPPPSQSASKRASSVSSSSSEDEASSEESNNEEEGEVNGGSAHADNIVTTTTSTVVVSTDQFQHPPDGSSSSSNSSSPQPATSHKEKSYTNTFKQISTDTPPSGMVKMEFANTTSNTSSPASAALSTTTAAEPSVIISASAPKRQKLIVSEVFNQDEEEDEVPKKRKLVPLQYTAEENKAVNDKKSVSQAEEKKRLQRQLIENIPMDKDSLFDYNIDWSAVDKTLMDNRIQPWITKKIVEYIGEEEPTLVEFICSKIMTKSNPERIHDDISMVLDDEAEVFVMKMWRLLIYEIEARKAGIQSW